MEGSGCFQFFIATMGFVRQFFKEFMEIQEKASVLGHLYWTMVLGFTIGGLMVICLAAVVVTVEWL